MSRLKRCRQIGPVFVAMFAALGLVPGLRGAAPLSFSPPPEGAPLEAAMASLATRAIAEYPNDGSDWYLSNLFRLQMTAGQYSEANATVDESIRRSTAAHRSVSTLIPDRVFAQAMLREQSGVPAKEAINTAAATVLGELDDKAAADAGTWLWAPLNRLSQNLNQALDRQRSLGTIELAEALNLIREYQLYQEYRALAPMSENLIAADDARRYIIERDVPVKTERRGHADRAAFSAASDRQEAAGGLEFHNLCQPVCGDNGPAGGGARIRRSGCVRPRKGNQHRSDPAVGG